MNPGFLSEGGPLVLFDSTWPALVLVWSPLSHFKSTQLGPRLTGPGAAGGVNGYITALPAGFTVSTGIYFGSHGITDTVHAWGAVLQAMYSTKRMEDPSSTRLSVWTDNGSYIYRCCPLS